MKHYSIVAVSLFIFITSLASCSIDGNGRQGELANKSQILPYRGETLIDSLLSAAVKDHEIPGAVAYVKKDGQEVYHKAFGWRNMQSNTPLKKNDIFRMASMTKGLTAVAVLQLYERGLLFLDDRVSKYLREFSDPEVLTDIRPDTTYRSRPADKDVTIRHLLTHTSGIGYGFQNEAYNKLFVKHHVSEGFEDDGRTARENIRRLAQLPLLHGPGEKYTYGMSYDVLGVLIEEVTGMRYDRYIKRYILDPLGMDNSYFIIPDEKRKRLVSVYQPAESGEGIEPATYPDTTYPTVESRRYFSGGADLCSTAEDYARFVQMVLNKGIYKGTRIIGERYIEMMLSRQTPFGGKNSDQGFAVWVTTEQGAAQGLMDVGSFGFGGFFDTYAWADPKEEFVAVLLLQMYPTNQHRVHQKFQNVVYGVIHEL